MEYVKPRFDTALIAYLQVIIPSSPFSFSYFFSLYILSPSPSTSTSTSPSPHLPPSPSPCPNLSPSLLSLILLISVILIPISLFCQYPHLDLSLSPSNLLSLFHAFIHSVSLPLFLPCTTLLHYTVRYCSMR